MFGKFVYDYGLTNKTNLTIETLAGIKVLDLITSNGKVEIVNVDMGEPILDNKRIPVNSEEEMINITEQGRDFSFKCLSTGNPHAVTIVQDVDKIDVCKFGPGIEKNSVFPEKANIEFIEILDNNTIKMRVWERGAGETLACGTGACASVVACSILGKTGRDVTVKLRGGDLKINWDKNTNHVFMKGPAKIVFEGVWDN